jgi:hypothetical protein
MALAPATTPALGVVIGCIQERGSGVPRSMQMGRPIAADAADSALKDDPNSRCRGAVRLCNVVLECAQGLRRTLRIR